MTNAEAHFADEIDAALALIADASRVESSTSEDGRLPSAFAVTPLAAASVGAAAREVVGAGGLSDTTVHVDARLASLWFGASIQPDWEVPPMWDAIAGVYETADGHIRLHTNLPHHRAAAVSALDSEETKESVAAAVRRLPGSEVEERIVAAGGCAAEFRSLASWDEHPQGRAVAAEPLVHVEEGASDVRPWAPAVDRQRPLAGLKVLDLTRVLAGPVATRFMAGWGAEVLRIDPPGWDENVVPDVALGKRCARLDLNDPHDKRTLAALIGQADVMVHGYRPDALQQLGFGPAVRQELRPGLVDVSLDAYGWTGPWAGRRGFDSLVQMSSGIAHEGMVRSGADGPFPLPVQALDHVAGYLLAASALRGLQQARDHGTGVIARTSLARVARLLVDGPAGSLDDALAPTAKADLSKHVERSDWGRARRLRGPVRIGDATMAWDIDAGPLGRHRPEFGSPEAADGASKGRWRRRRS